MVDNMTLGRRIKLRREQLNLSQTELANLAGIHQPQISRYEKDESLPAADIVLALAKTLGVSTDWLLGHTPEAYIEGITEEEQQVLAMYRTKPAELKSAIMQILRLA